MSADNAKKRVLRAKRILLESLIKVQLNFPLTIAQLLGYKAGTMFSTDRGHHGYWHHHHSGGGPAIVLYALTK
jgi:hypothetical protein